MIIDTAADISLINPRLFNYNLNGLKNSHKNIIIMTVSGEEFPHKGVKEITLCVGNAYMNLDVAITNIKEDCILGLDFLYKSGLLSDFQSIINRKFNINHPKKLISIKQITLLENADQSTIPEFLTQLSENSCELLNYEEQQKFKQFLLKFQSSFSKNSNDLGRYKGIYHKIITGNNPPLKQQPRRIPFHYRDKAFEMLEQMKIQKVIEPSFGPWASPVVIIKKKRGFNSFLC